MKKGIIRFLLVSFVLFFALSTGITGVQAAPASSKTSADLEKAEVFGDIDMTTSKKTTVIVELKEKSLAEAKEAGESQSKSKLKTARTKAKNKAIKAVKNGKVNREYEQVFSGFSMKLACEEKDTRSLLSSAVHFRCGFPFLLQAHSRTSAARSEASIPI